MRVLVVDDSRAMRQAVIDALPLAGVVAAEVHEAADGREALERVAGLGALDLVVTDWCMPRLDGVSFIAEMRRLGHAIPIVLVTTASGLSAREEAMNAGASAFVTKPVTPEKLDDALTLCADPR